MAALEIRKWVSHVVADGGRGHHRVAGLAAAEIRGGGLR
jgi:hypothetical protein